MKNALTVSFSIWLLIQFAFQQFHFNCHCKVCNKKKIVNSTRANLSSFQINFNYAQAISSMLIVWLFDCWELRRIVEGLPWCHLYRFTGFTVSHNFLFVEFYNFWMKFLNRKIAGEFVIGYLSLVSFLKVLELLGLVGCEEVLKVF